jgi:glycosyltransferase involved in cell wall biosynthesis
MKEKKRVCVISPEIVGPHTNGGIGTHCYYLSAFLSKQLGQDVTFLYTGKIERRTESYWEKWFRDNLGITFAWLRPPKDPDGTPLSLHSGLAQTASLVYQWLAARKFDHCYFQEMLGNGFRCFQAKRLGLAFRDTILTCTVHSSWEWVCQAMQSLPQTGMEELQVKFMERYCIQHCDWLISPSEYMLRWLAENQVPLPERKSVLPYLFDPELKPVGHQPAADHLIFFGRLEVRKGLLLFLEALRALDQAGEFAGRNLRVTFLGRSGYTPDGGGLASIENFRGKFSNSIQVELLTEMGHRQAMEFLIEHRQALVVCPSLVDNSPYAVIESLQLGLNIIAARSGGIPELFAGEERLFAPECDALAKKLTAGLKNEVPAPTKKYDLKRSSQLWQDFAENKLAEIQLPARREQCGKASDVRVVVAAGTSEASLRRTLAALESQTLSPESVTLVWNVRGNGGVPEDIRKRCQQRGWEILEPAGPMARSTSPNPASEPRYDLYLSPGFVPAATLCEKMVAALDCSGLSALTCWSDITDTHEQTRAFTFAPLGPCIEGGIFRNLLGAGCLLTRPKDVLGANNWQRVLAPDGIWVHLAERTVRGEAWDVLPEVLGSLEVAEPEKFGAAPDYNSQMEILNSCTAGSPIWLRYILVNAVGAHRKLHEAEQQMESMRSQAKYTPQGVVYKVKRETKRVIKQLQNLGKS